MKSIAIILETLRNGNVRATARHDGRTVAWKDGEAAQAAVLLDVVMAETCSAHRVGGFYDMTYIQLNDAAQLAMGGAQ